MAATEPYLIGVAGGSGAGKTSFAHALAEHLGEATVILPLDAYYHDRSHLSAATRVATNFDHPDALDMALLVRHLRTICRGHAIDRPVYDFVTHCRREQTVRITPGRFVIAEGLLTFYWEATRSLCRTRIFLDVPASVRLRRRVARDTTERGRSEQSVRDQWAATVDPTSRRYVEPTRTLAHVVVDADTPVDQMVTSVVQRFGW